MLTKISRKRLKSYLGGVAERLNATVLKTVRGASLSWVRIPPPPPISYLNPPVSGFGASRQSDRNWQIFRRVPDILPTYSRHRPHHRIMLAIASAALTCISGEECV